LLLAAQAQNVIPMFLMKGGMAMELRFGVRARASKDVDVGITAPLGQLLEVLDRVLAIGFGGVTFKRKREPELLEAARAYRLEVQLAYKGRPFGVLAVDLTEADHEYPSEIVSTGIIADLGLPGPLSIPVLDSYLQVAQKLHALTEPSRSDYTNNRYRDVIDVLLFADDASINMARLRRVAAKEFASRSTHKHWPPLFGLPERWRAPLQVEAERVRYPETDPRALEQQLLTFIARIEGIAVKKTHEYKFMSLQLTIAGGDGVLAPAAQAELDSHIGAGWRALSISSRPGFMDQFLAILERPQSILDQLPRLQLRMKTEYVSGGAQMVLSGVLRNENGNPAVKVRVFMSGVEGVTRLGTVTIGDGDLPVSIRYDNQPARTQRAQFPVVIVQYLADDGTKVQQVGELDASGSDASGRYTYNLLGLGPPRAIDQFTHRHDPLDDL